MKNVIIAGTNGMIGHHILELCLASDKVNQVTSITRKALNINHPKLRMFVSEDLSQLDELDEAFTNQDVCFYCAGVYTGQVPKEEFIRVTVDLPLIFAKKLRQKNDKLHFCLLSGQGADQSEKSNILFAKYKGRIERLLLDLNFRGTALFRPGYIYPVVWRKEPNLMYRVLRFIYKPLSFIYPNIGVTSLKLAQKMFDIGIHGSDKIIFENRDIRN